MAVTGKFIWDTFDAAADRTYRNDSTPTEEKQHSSGTSFTLLFAMLHCSKTLSQPKHTVLHQSHLTVTLLNIWDTQNLIVFLHVTRSKVQYMDKGTWPPPHYTYRSPSAMETYAMKLSVHNFCTDVNARGGFESAEHWWLLHSPAL